MLPEKLSKKIKLRIQNNSLRSLPVVKNLVDYSTNDYLGFATQLAYAKPHSKKVHALLRKHKLMPSGATGSRLLTGNHELYGIAESIVSEFHNSPAALIFNSGYDANLGFFQSVPQRGDVVLYDAHAHASIRDGLRLGNAKAYKFNHNDVTHLTQLLMQFSVGDVDREVYVVTEAVFSMDGDNPDIFAIAKVCAQYKARLVVDEAHALGVIGVQGKGLIQLYNLEQMIFARIVTYGKAMGAHGAAILGSAQLCDYLVNFSRPLIYTTALPPHSVAAIIASYELLIEQGVHTSKDENAVLRLQYNINVFKSAIENMGISSYFIPSNSAIQCAIIPGNVQVATLSRKLKQQNFDVRPIYSPTVPEGEERLRFCIHSFNARDEILQILTVFKESIEDL